MIGGAQTANVYVLHGHGDGTFRLRFQFSTGNASSQKSVALGDFDNDGRLDLAFTVWATSNVVVLLGNGDGSFNKQAVYSTGDDGEPRWVAVNDFNKDGRMDLAVANTQMNTIGIFLGNGDGSFGEQTVFSAGFYSAPTSVAVGDFNGDNLLDIAATNFGHSSVSILLGSGVGTFGESTMFKIGSHSNPTSVIVGDFNNDKQLDLAVNDSENGNLVILIGDGTGNFEMVMIFATGADSYPGQLAAADLNSDGLLDIVVVLNGLSRIGILLNACSCCISSSPQME